jgi:glucose/arabinose dehydrogenase/mono/diheme cytochrome c family protein
MPKLYFAAFLIFFIVLSFTQYQSGSKLPHGDKDNGGLYLPGGFEAVVVVDSLRGQARHLAVNSNGDIYVKSTNHARYNNLGNVALRDVNNDGKADIITPFDKYESDRRGTEMRIHNGYLYFSSNFIVYRQKLIPGQLLPESKMDSIVVDEPVFHQHQAKAIAFDGKGRMYVGWGAGSNNCEGAGRKPSSPGMGKPDVPGEGCPLLEDHASIWMFDENKIGQKQADGVKYATGLRSMTCMAWDTNSSSLYTVMHGRDNLKLLWPDLYTSWESAMLPGEEFFKINKGFNGGWPYYYYDQMKGKKVLSPEYGGDKKKEAPAKIARPLMAFPGHFAPNDLLFYKGNQFPARYKSGAFVALHGSTNRSPYPQAGYIVAFVPMKNGVVTGQWEVFADGFAKVDPILSAGNAVYRPMGLAEGPDGSLYICDSEKGKIWRVMFKGNKTTFGTIQLAAMVKRKLTASNIRTPDPVMDDLDRGKPAVASTVYTTYCRACHQQDGRGDGTRFPPLAGSEWVNGDKTRLIKVILDGLQGQIQVKGLPYSEMMPAHGTFLNDEQIAEVLTYIRSSSTIGNNSGPVSPSEVSAVRKASGTK